MCGDGHDEIHVISLDSWRTLYFPSSFKIFHWIWCEKPYKSIATYLVEWTRSSNWSTIGWNRLTMPPAIVSLVGLSHKFSVFSSTDVAVLSESITWPFIHKTISSKIEKHFDFDEICRYLSYKVFIHFTTLLSSTYLMTIWAKITFAL